MRLKPGIYEQLVTRTIEAALQKLPAGQYVVEALDRGDSHAAIAQHLAAVLFRALGDFTGDDRPNAQAAVYNAVLEVLRSVNTGTPDGELIDAPPRSLRLVRAEVPAIGVPTADPARPDTPLSFGCILTGNTRVDPTLESQLRKELSTADRVDFLCSFIKWGGIRTIRESLESFAARSTSRLRVITTCYIGATDPRALDFLIGLPRTEVRVSYDTKHTRLHAKAYLFERDSYFSTAYVGSANLSHAAMTDGLEWTVKVSQRESTHLWDKLSGTFESYWNDPNFRRYTVDERETFIKAIQAERGGDLDEGSSDRVFFDLQPHEFQRAILDAIQAEREVLGRKSHLVVAATGTGKTMIAAFDYRHVCAGGNRPKLLFIAHREELLKQARATFRQVLRDMNFGDLLFGGQSPTSLDHLFCTVQSYNSRNLGQLPHDHFEYVVIDEFHHAAAASYQPLLKHLSPRTLLGLTATPERADLKSVFEYFGGKATAEIRLPDAVTRKLLCPFQYFGVSDDPSVDLSAFRWVRGAYVEEELDRAYTGNKIRAQLVIDKIREIVTDPRRCRGLGFCVGIRHAAFMAACFNEAGIPSEVLTADSPQTVRDGVQERLRSRKINFIFTVDLYNEGVDIPEIDTVLFLRPTESLTVFLQQLGRGLRHFPEKDTLTVLDFVGRQHVSFRFDRRFRALLTDASRNVGQELEGGFPHLPPGCSIVLEKQARDYILENIRQAVISNTRALRREYTEVKSLLGRVPTLAEFLRATDLDSVDLHKRVTLARLEAGPNVDRLCQDEQRLRKGMARLAHIDDPQWIRSLLRLRPFGGDQEELDARTRRYVAMLHASLWGEDHRCDSAEESLGRLGVNQALMGELRELLQVKLEGVRHVAPVLSLPINCPLSLHCQYTRDEILMGMGYWSFRGGPPVNAGVLQIQSAPCDVFFVTLNKTEKDYSPTTMYEDYAISESLFHWQSQNATSEDSPTGRRYRESGGPGNPLLLFVRVDSKGPFGSSPYYFMGPVHYESHIGSRPMSVTWRLDYPMAAAILQFTRRLAG